MKRLLLAIAALSVMISCSHFSEDRVAPVKTEPIDPSSVGYYHNQALERIFSAISEGKTHQEAIQIALDWLASQGISESSIATKSGSEESDSLLVLSTEGRQYVTEIMYPFQNLDMDDEEIQDYLDSLDSVISADTQLSTDEIIVLQATISTAKSSLDYWNEHFGDPVGDVGVPSSTDEVQSSNNMVKYTGRVYNDMGEPLIGAAILIQGTVTGAVTDIDGCYSLYAPAGSLFHVTCIGYHSMLVPARHHAIIILREDDESGFETPSHGAQSHLSTLRKVVQCDAAGALVGGLSSNKNWFSTADAIVQGMYASYTVYVSESNG